MTHLEVNQAINVVILICFRASGVMALFFELFVPFLVVLVTEAGDARGTKRMLQFQHPVVGVISVIRYGSVAVRANAHAVTKVVSVLDD